MREKEFKVTGCTVLYWNGEKWLIKETCNTEIEAQALYEQLTIDEIN